jgi:hypothetical protein
MKKLCLVLFVALLSVGSAFSGGVDIKSRSGVTNVPVIVGEGGTGVTTLTDGGVLLGSGTGSITSMAVLTDGQIIVGDGTTDPVAESGATARTSLGAAASGINSDITQTLGLTSIENGGTITIESTGAAVAINTHSDASDDFTVNSTQFLVSGDTGDIGIGTNVPAVRLEIKDANTQSIVRVSNTGGEVTTDEVVGELQFYNNDADGAHISSFVKAIAREGYGRKGALVFGVATTNATDAVEALRINEDGSVVFTGLVNKIAFPVTEVPSGDANTLDDYDEYTAASTACTGALTNSISYKLVKIGRVVTLVIPAITGTTSDVGTITLGVTLPAKYRPSANVTNVALIWKNAITEPGILLVRSSGVITIASMAGNWGTAANSGTIYDISFSWVL